MDHSMQTYLENYFFLRHQWGKQKQKHLPLKNYDLFLYPFFTFQDSDLTSPLRTAHSSDY